MSDQEADLPAKQQTVVDDPTPQEHFETAADGLSAFNSILWEIAKTFAIITVILMMAFFLFMAYHIAQWGMTTL